MTGLEVSLNPRTEALTTQLLKRLHSSTLATLRLYESMTAMGTYRFSELDC